MTVTNSGIITVLSFKKHENPGNASFPIDVRLYFCDGICLRALIRNENLIDTIVKR